jgi:hypothetical protein
MSAQDERDPYASLRPKPTAGVDEICHCTDSPAIVLHARLSSSNPIACLRCNQEVPPERVGFSAQLAGNIAYWCNLRRALYTLWLDSEDYEAWARAQLEDPEGRVNISGLDAVEELNRYRRAYYAWFEDRSADHDVVPSQCPRCSDNLVEVMGWLVCDKCSIGVVRPESPIG